MRPLLEHKVFFLRLLLCLTVFPALAAILVSLSPQNPLPIFLSSSFFVDGAVLGCAGGILK